jgi:hypothetical protein
MFDQRSPAPGSLTGLLAGQGANEGKRGHSHRHYNGKKYQAAFLKALPCCYFHAFQDPVGGQVENDCSDGEIENFHG